MVGADVAQQLEPEDRTHPLGALEAHLPAHQLGQAAGNGEAKAGAAELAVGAGVGLLETVEERGLGAFGHADAGVVHLAAQLARRAADVAHPHFHAAGVGELDGVADDVEQALAQADRVDVRPARLLGGGAHVEVLGVGLGLQQGHDAGHHGDRIRGRRRHLQLAGFHLGEVEHVIDQLGQHVAAGQRLAQQVAALGAQRLALEQVEHADDAIHRRADLVAHRGQEAGLRRRRRFRKAARFGERQLLAFLIVDVEQQADAADGCADRIALGLPVDPHPDRAVATHHARLAGHGVARFQAGLAHRTHGVAVVRMEDHPRIVRRRGGLDSLFTEDIAELRRQPVFALEVVVAEHSGAGGGERQLQPSRAGVGFVAGLGQVGDALAEPYIS